MFIHGTPPPQQLPLFLPFLILNLMLSLSFGKVTKSSQSHFDVTFLRVGLQSSGLHLFLAISGNHFPGAGFQG